MITYTEQEPTEFRGPFAARLDAMRAQREEEARQRAALEAQAAERVAQHRDTSAADAVAGDLAELRQQHARLDDERSDAATALAAARLDARHGGRAIDAMTRAQSRYDALCGALEDVSGQIALMEARHAAALAEVERAARVEALRTLASEMKTARSAANEQITAMVDALRAALPAIGAQRASYRALRRQYWPLAQQLGASTIHLSGGRLDHDADQTVLRELKRAGVDVDALNTFLMGDYFSSGPLDSCESSPISDESIAGLLGQLLTLADQAPQPAPEG